MDLETKWGHSSYDTNREILGQHTVMKIACIQFAVIVCILLLKQPFLIMNVKHDYKSKVCIFKVFILSSLVVLGTYFIPQIIRNS